MEHIWTMLMHKILQNHLLCAFVANLKIGGIYALYPESFCDKNLAIRKVFAFCDSENRTHRFSFLAPEMPFLKWWKAVKAAFSHSQTKIITFQSYTSSQKSIPTKKTLFKALQHILCRLKKLQQLHVCLCAPSGPPHVMSDRGICLKKLQQLHVCIWVSSGLPRVSTSLAQDPKTRLRWKTHQPYHH